MGKLLTGHFGREPEAESIALSLIEASQKLGLKPSDFVSTGPPTFFKKNYGAPGHYLLFQVEPAEVEGKPIWKTGYYLLPLEAADILKMLEKNRLNPAASAGGRFLPIQPIQTEQESAPPPGVQKRLELWLAKAQPLFFTCGCEHLELKLDAPRGLRRRWKARLRCPRRCQPALIALL